MLPGTVCSRTVKPLALHSSTDKTTVGKEMFTRNTSGAKEPSSKSKYCFSATVSARTVRDAKNKEMRAAHAGLSSATASLPTVGNRHRLQQRWHHDGKEDFVSGVLVRGVFGPEQLQHRLDFVRRVVVIILNVTLQNKA